MDIFSKSNNAYYDKIEKEILNDFPEFKNLIEMRYFGKDADSPLLAAEAHLSSQNSSYINSQYFYVGESFSFLHFTSIKVLLSILNSQTIRLRTLNGMNDVNEINYAARIFNIDKTNIELLQKEIFSLSLVKYVSSDKEIINNTNNLDLWRFYGLNGEGVAIKFKIINDPRIWNSFHLSSIFYGEKEVERLKILQERINVFNSNNQKIYIHLPNIFSFHKSSHFKNEDEIRLIYSTFYNFRENKHYKTKTISDASNLSLPTPPVKINNTENYFLSIPLSKRNNTNLENSIFCFSPKIEI